MENKAHALAAGLFVLVVGGLLVALAAWLHTDTRERFVYELSTPYSLNGLQSQAAVRYRGITIGKVTDMGLDPAAPGHVLVRLALDNNRPITQATYATLGQQGVTGIAFVDLNDDPARAAAPLPTSASQPARIPYRQDLLGRLADQGERLLGQVQAVTERLNQWLGPASQQRVLSAVAHIDQAAAGASRLADTLQGTVTRQLNPALAAVPPALHGLSQASAQAEALLQKAQAPDGLLDSLQRTSAAAGATADALQQSTLPRLDRVMDDTSRTVRSAGRVSAALSDNPQALIFGTGAPPPGPGEPGFVAPTGSAAP